jgi:hypothetical protein
MIELPQACNEKAWKRTITSKQVQGFAGKIEKILPMEGEGRELVKTLVEKYAELTDVRAHFPDLEDVFTPEAIFCIEYAFWLQVEKEDWLNGSCRVRRVLVYISNLVANHDHSFATLKRLYNAKVAYWAAGALTPLDESTNRRNEPHLFILPNVAKSKPKQKRKKKATRLIENHYFSLNPKFSIGENGELTITLERRQ